MPGKKSVKSTLKESLALQVKAQQFYGYADRFKSEFFCRLGIFEYGVLAVGIRRMGVVISR